jgi:hypothetical protein
MGLTREHTQQQQQQLQHQHTGNCSDPGSDTDWKQTYLKKLHACVANIDPDTRDWIDEFINSSPVSPECVPVWVIPHGSLAFYSLVLTSIMQDIDTKEAQTLVENDRSLKVCGCSSLAPTCMALTYNDPNNTENNGVSTTLIRSVGGQWRYTTNYQDAVSDNMPSPAATKEWMTMSGIIPLRVVASNQSSPNTLYTYAVCQKQSAIVIHESVYKDLVCTYPSDIAQLVTSYL